MDYEIQRFCWFDTVDKKGEPRDNIWKYKRAIENHKLLLVGIEVSQSYEADDNVQHFQVYNGKVYSHWGSFPNIFDQQTLAMITFVRYGNMTYYIPLNNWECKETTMSMRNEDAVKARVFCAILWFYEIPMSKLDTFEYAVKQPRYRIRHGSARTLDRFED